MFLFTSHPPTLSLSLTSNRFDHIIGMFTNYLNQLLCIPFILVNIFLPANLRYIPSLVDFLKKTIKENDKTRGSPLLDHALKKAGISDELKKLIKSPTDCPDPPAMKSSTTTATASDGDGMGVEDMDKSKVSNAGKRGTNGKQKTEVTTKSAAALSGKAQLAALQRENSLLK